MATEDQSLTPQEQAKLKAFAQGLPDEPGDIDVDAIAQQTGTSRRQVLQVIAAVGVGSIAGGVSVSQLVSEAQAAASTSDGDGNVGTPTDRVDVFADGVDASVIDTDQVSNSEIYANRYATLQAAHDAIPAGGNQAAAERRLVIPPSMQEISETLDITTTGLKTELPGGTYPRLTGSGDHTVDVQAQDCTIEGGWVDQTDSSGNYDAIHITSREVQLYDVDVDNSPRYGVHLNSITRAEVRGLQFSGGADDTALYSTAANSHIEALGVNLDGNGAYIGNDKNLLELSFDGLNGYGVEVAGSTNHGSIIVGSAGADGVVVSGTRNILTTESFGATGTDIVVSGSQNTLDVGTNGDLTIQSGASNNTIEGYVGGTLTDNGSGNDISSVQ